MHFKYCVIKIQYQYHALWNGLMYKYHTHAVRISLRDVTSQMIPQCWNRTCGKILISSYERITR